MLEKVKLDLRINHNALNTDIELNIDACKSDLGLAGVITTGRETYPLIQQAVILYCRWKYDYRNDGERYGKAYENLKSAMSLTAEYTEEVEDE